MTEREPSKPVAGGVRYSARDDVYFSKRALARYANVWHLWALGVGAVSVNSQNDTQRNEETLVQIVCGLRGFVDGLLDAGTEREAVLARFDESLPDVTCPAL